MSRDKKLHIREDVSMLPSDVSGEIVRLQKKQQPLKEMLADCLLDTWDVEVFDSDRKRVHAHELETSAMVRFLEESEVEHILVSVGDSMQLVHLIFRPRVPINLSESTVEYFEWKKFLKCIINDFLRNVHFPFPETGTG